MRVYRDGFLAFNKIKKDYLGFVYCNQILRDVFQLQFWSDEEMYNACVAEWSVSGNVAKHADK